LLLFFWILWIDRIFMPRTDDSRDPRVYLAVERTFLAWIRTGLALMGFGFVVARFGLFLRELASMRVVSTADLSGLSVPVGTGLIVIGVAVNILASINHVRFIKRLNEGTPVVGRPSALALVVALLLAAAGLAMAIYLGSHEIR
jgi:putative membrane protein